MELCADFNFRRRCASLGALWRRTQAPVAASGSLGALGASPAGSSTVSLSRPHRTRHCGISIKEFIIHLLPSKRKRLGVGATHADNGRTLLLTRIDEQGLVADWNTRHPASGVSLGDSIVEVNGKRGNVEVLAAELRSHQLLKIVLRRSRSLDGEQKLVSKEDGEMSWTGISTRAGTPESPLPFKFANWMVPCLEVVFDTGNGQERLVTFKLRPLGMDWGQNEPGMPITVSAVVHGGHAQGLGVKVGWVIKSIGSRRNMTSRQSFSESAALLTRGIEALPEAAARYSSLEPLRQALDNDAVVLLKGSWLIEQAMCGRVLPKRQDLPEDAVWDTVDVKERLGREGQQGIEIVAVSHCWHDAEHPDPEGELLWTLAPLIEEFASAGLHELPQKLGRETSFGSDASMAKKMKSVAVFIDWCSLYQRPRTQRQEAAYKCALRDVDLWYAHERTHVFMLTGSCKGASAPYSDQGWPTFEASISSMAKDSRMVHDVGKLDPGWAGWDQVMASCRVERRPPATPARFEQELREKVLTDEADRQFLVGKYAETFMALLANITCLLLHGLLWNDDDVVKLAEVLPQCGQLQVLSLYSNRIGNAGVAAIAEVLPCCVHLRSLLLYKNKIGDIGAIALAAALPQCDQLKELFLFANDLTESGKELLRGAWGRGADPPRPEAGLVFDWPDD